MKIPNRWHAALLSASLVGIASPAVLAQTDYALQLDGTSQSVETQITGDKLAGNELSIEYWFKGPRMLSAVRIQNNIFTYIVAGWGGGSGPTGASPLHLINPAGQEFRLQSTPVTQDGNWHHIVLTYKRNTALGMASYVDGKIVERKDAPDQPIPSMPSTLYFGSLNGTQEYMQGALDEVRIWKRSLTDVEVADHAKNPRRLVGNETGLLAYFPFNEPNGSTTLDKASGQTATLRNSGVNSRVALSGLFFSDPSGILSTNLAAGGLWKGEVSLKQVSQIYGSSYTTDRSPAGSAFNLNILLHVDATGVVRLLKDVTIMQLPGASPTNALDTTKIVLVTDDTQLPSFTGVLKRNGKLVGARLSSPFYQFAGNSALLAGGLGLGYATEGTIAIPASLPGNPFRHKYHHDLRDPRDLQGNPYDLSRKIHIDFSEQTLSPGDGRDRLKGTYRETMGGLNKDSQPIIVEGTISLERISLVTKLNNQ